jgi:CubicO group peptidase (beta-lactamase class C family)
MSRTVSLSAIALLLGTPAHAQDAAAKLDELFSWVVPGMPGCAVAVARDGEVVVNRAYGLANLETGAPIGSSTIFDIGSVQKQFDAAAALLLVEEGRLSLAADIREYLPELPDYGHRITLDHLMTHTSGIRDWLALMNFNRGDEDALTLILRQRGLNFAPGEEWAYSNSNYVLLKEIVARASGMSFSEFARRRLFEPLGMEHTMYAADIRAAETGALAYEQEGDAWRPAMMLGDERGGGAVLSTVSDLLIWNDALTSGRLGAFVTGKLEEPARLSNGRELTYAHGLFVEDTRYGRAAWHTGSARAYKALLSRLPDQGLSIAMLCNAGDTGDRNLEGRRIADLFLPEAAVREAEAAEAPTAADAGALTADLTGQAGLFFNQRDGEPLRLVVQNGRLRVAGGPLLVTVAEDRFRNPSGRLSFMSEDEFELHFLSHDTLDLISMEGAVTRYRRARPYAPGAAEVQEFAGRYDSDDLGAVFEITPADSGLTVRLNGNGARTIGLAPVDPDTFQRGPFTVRFRRDDTGRVAALEFSTPVLRNVPFARADDGITRNRRDRSEAEEVP